MIPDAGYVTRLLERLRTELQVFQEKIIEIEDLRYFEDKIKLSPTEKQSGIEVRTGLSAELIENVKASMVANPPLLSFEPYRSSDKAMMVAAKREKFWNSFIRWVNSPSQVFNELVDAQVGTGLGILKGAVLSYPQEPQKRRERSGYREPDREYLDRVYGLRRSWGPPFSAIQIHPLSYYFRRGVGDKVVESIEHGYKPRMEVYRTFGIADDRDLKKRGIGKQLDNEVASRAADDYAARVLRAQSGTDAGFLRPLPQGFDTTGMCRVTEYWSEDCYQTYVDNRLIYQEENPGVKYFLCKGVTTSSKDPDKFSLSVAESLRHNEPTINRALTRMFEANELIVRKRLTIEFPEDFTEPLTMRDKDGNEVPRTFDFRADVTEALPPGARVVDPFTGTEHVYQSLPAIQMLMGIMAQQGLNPIFKGMPPGAGGSGYRDNSLYMMAAQKYQYYKQAYEGAVAEFITWAEQMIVDKIRTRVYCHEHYISPSDIEDYPCDIKVSIKPSLPQNIQAEATLMDRMHAQGHVSRQRVREDGLHIEDPIEEDRRIIKEQAQQVLAAQMVMDVVQSVTGRLPGTPNPGEDEMGASPFDRRVGQGGAEQVLGGTGRGIGRENGGLATRGMQRQPPNEPGSFPPGAEDQL